MEKTKSQGKTKRDLFTDLVLEVFRLNGQLLAEGDRLTAEFGLTSARWQVMGAIDGEAIPVVQIAHKMGLKRQSVQRLVDVLADEGLVEFRENPHHQRAKLVQLTDEGHKKLEQIEQIQREWANSIANGLDVEQIRNTINLLQQLRTRLQ
jgi:DNA-binding MarR family transcriptional regulator